MFDFEGSRIEFLKILVEMGEEPAFIGRARAAEKAYESLMVRCRAEQDEGLKWARRHFGVLRKRCGGDWARFVSLVSDANAYDIFAELSEHLPAADYEPASWFATDRSVLRSFLKSGERFNTAWTRFLDSEPFQDVNQRRDEYNRFYPMEKASAFGNDSVTADFKPLAMLGPSWLESEFPLLHLPTLKSRTNK